MEKTGKIKYVEKYLQVHFWVAAISGKPIKLPVNENQPIAWH